MAPQQQRFQVVEETSDFLPVNEFPTDDSLRLADGVSGAIVTVLEDGIPDSGWPADIRWSKVRVEQDGQTYLGYVHNLPRYVEWGVLEPLRVDP